MDTNKYTKKALEAINNAQTLALERHNQQINPEHIAYALLNDEEGLIPKLVNYNSIKITFQQPVLVVKYYAFHQVVSLPIFTDFLTSMNRRSTVFSMFLG